MRHLTVICLMFLCVAGAAQSTAQPQVYFPKEVPKEQSDILINRIMSFADVVREGHFEHLKVLWHNSFDNIEFDGNFIVRYDGDMAKLLLGEYYKKGDIMTSLFHWTGKSEQILRDSGLDGDGEDGLFPVQNRFSLFLTHNLVVRGCIERGSASRMFLTTGFSEITGQAKNLMLKIFEEGKSKEKIGECSFRWENDQLSTTGDTAVIKKLPSLKKENKVKQSIKWGNTVKIPRVDKDKDLQTFFDRMQTITAARKYEEFVKLLELPHDHKQIKPDNPKPHKDMISFQLLFCEWKCAWGCAEKRQLSDDSIDDNVYRYVYVNKPDGSLESYFEGNVGLPDKYDGKPFLQKTGRGIEVRFHSNGYPKSYRTLVRNRLFGRQIEWDDKGNVVSDVDLDIPKEIKEPKKKGSETNPVIDDVQEK